MVTYLTFNYDSFTWATSADPQGQQLDQVRLSGLEARIQSRATTKHAVTKETLHSRSTWEPSRPKAAYCLQQQSDKPLLRTNGSKQLFNEGSDKYLLIAYI